MARPREDIYIRLERFKKVDPITGCWLWTGKLSRDGYGMIGYKLEVNQTYHVGVHRLAAILYRKLPIDSPLLTCHKDICPHRNCFNPEHTFDGTYSDNNTKKLCNRGHDNWYVNPRNKNRYCKTCAKAARSKHV